LSKLESTKRTNAIFLLIILLGGTFAAIFPSFMIGAHAHQYGMDHKYNTYEQDYGIDRYDDKQSYGKDYNSYDKSKYSSSVNVKKIECNNFNVNGLGINALPLDLRGLASEALAEDEGANGASSLGSGSGSDGRSSGHDGDNIKVVCISNNGKETPVAPPPPPTPPTTASLTVNKEIFGCTIFGELSMNCRDLQSNSSQWISCNDPSINGTRACQSLNENSFDIEVLNASNNQQITQFEGSAAGTTIPNLQPGTYTINEIESTTSDRDQLGDFLTDCAAVGFPDGGTFFNTNPSPPSFFDLFYSAICFEYEEEPGNNNCNTITLAAGEHRTCTVKNYIRSVTAFD